MYSPLRTELVFYLACQVSTDNSQLAYEKCFVTSGPFKDMLIQYLNDSGISPVRRFSGDFFFVTNLWYFMVCVELKNVQSE